MPSCDVTSVRVDNNLCVLSRVVQQSDRQWDMSLSFSLTGGSRIWTSLRPAQSSSHQPSKSLSTDRVSLCSSWKMQENVLSRSIYCRRLIGHTWEIMDGKILTASLGNKLGKLFISSFPWEWHKYATERHSGLKAHLFTVYTFSYWLLKPYSGWFTVTHVS